jgi:hypothetical protein
LVQSAVKDTWLGQLTPTNTSVQGGVVHDSLAYVYLDGHYLNGFPLLWSTIWTLQGLQEVPFARAMAPMI